jgi:hypothetical protein
MYYIAKLSSAKAYRKHVQLVACSNRKKQARTKKSCSGGCSDNAYIATSQDSWLDQKSQRQLLSGQLTAIQVPAYALTRFTPHHEHACG